MGNDVSPVFVVLMGLGTVFIGLICIILLCLGIRFLCRLIEKPSTDKKKEEPPASAVSSDSKANRQELIAVIAAVLAEEMGTDVSGLRIRSIRKV